jgi:hypothetical protein
VEGLQHPCWHGEGTSLPSGVHVTRDSTAATQCSNDPVGTPIKTLEGRLKKFPRAIHGVSNSAAICRVNVKISCHQNTSASYQEARGQFTSLLSIHYNHKIGGVNLRLGDRPRAMIGQINSARSREKNRGACGTSIRACEAGRIHHDVGNSILQPALQIRTSANIAVTYNEDVLRPSPSAQSRSRIQCPTSMKQAVEDVRDRHKNSGWRGAAITR